MPDVLGSGTPAVAEDRTLPNHAAVGAGPAEPHAERAREGRLHPAGVGASRESAVAPGCLKSLNRSPGSYSRGGGRGPGRGKVGEVVEPCRSPAELLVKTFSVADHR